MQVTERVPEIIERLMPAAPNSQLLEAAENFQAYLALVLRIYERRSREKMEFDSRPPLFHDKIDIDQPAI